MLGYNNAVPMPYSGITMELGVVLKVINHVN
jgi:hypothetical protein